MWRLLPILVCVGVARGDLAYLTQARLVESTYVYTGASGPGTGALLLQAPDFGVFDEVSELMAPSSCTARSVQYSSLGLDGIVADGTASTSAYIPPDDTIVQTAHSVFEVSFMLAAATAYVFDGTLQVVIDEAADGYATGHVSFDWLSPSGPLISETQFVDVPLALHAEGILDPGLHTIAVSAEAELHVLDNQVIASSAAAFAFNVTLMPEPASAVLLVALAGLVRRR